MVVGGSNKYSNIQLPAFNSGIEPSAPPASSDYILLPTEFHSVVDSTSIDSFSSTKIPSTYELINRSGATTSTASPSLYAPNSAENGRLFPFVTGKNINALKKSEILISTFNRNSTTPISTKNLVGIGRQAARFELSSKKIQNKPLEKSFNPIILTNRGCTDVCCCMLFTVFLFGWITVAFVALILGKPERLIHPTDSRGRICGHDRLNAYNLSTKPYLQFFDLTRCISYVTVLTGCPTPQICVDKCPTAYFSYLQLQSIQSSTEFRQQVQDKLICDELVDKNEITNFMQVKTLVDSEHCVAYTVNSASVLGRCVPRVFMDAAQSISNLQSPSINNSSMNQLISMLGNDGGVVPSDKQISESSKVVDGIVNSRAIIQKIAADISAGWWQIITFALIAGLVSLFYMILLRIFGGAMIWLSLLFLLVLLGVGSSFCWIRHRQLVHAGAINDFSFQPVIGVYFEMPTTWLVFAIALSVLFVTVVVIFLFVRSRIRLAVALIEETSKLLKSRIGAFRIGTRSFLALFGLRALGNMLSTLFFPIFPLICHLIVFAVCASVTIWLSSSGDENCRRPRLGYPSDYENGEKCDCNLLGTSVDPYCRYVNITRDNDLVMILQGYNLFAFFWLSCFIAALSDITIAGAFASYYFAFRKPKDVPSFPVLRSFGRSLRFHTGTIAFGSLVLSIVKFFQVILDFLNNRLKGAENRVTKAIYRGLKCLFYVMEHFLRFLSKNAYILTSIYGKGFCQSSRDSFDLLTRNIVRVVVLNRTTAFLLFVGKILITLGIGASSYYYFTGQWVIDGFPQIYFYYHFVPITLVIVLTYLICDSFFQVYNMGVDTTFLCFLEDSEANDGSVEKPYYMSNNLKKILGKENKF